MKYRLHIPYASRTDLLFQAVESARPLGNIHLWADGCPMVDLPDITPHPLPPLGPVAVINLMLQNSWDDDVVFMMHNDAYAQPGGCERLLGRATAKFNSDEKWGALFTCYDTFMCMNMKAVREVGFWDTRFFQYKADNDFYYRMKLAGYIIEDDGPKEWYPEKGKGVEICRQAKVVHYGSMTIKSDDIFRRKTRVFELAIREYYRQKWGGDCGQERFKTAFNLGG